MHPSPTLEAFLSEIRVEFLTAYPPTVPMDPRIPSGYRKAGEHHVRAPTSEAACKTFAQQIRATYGDEVFNPLYVRPFTVEHDKGDVILSGTVYTFDQHYSDYLQSVLRRTDQEWKDFEWEQTMLQLRGR